MTIEELFKQEYDAWYNETCFDSTGRLMFSNEHYKNIVAMGNDVVPCIIDKLVKDGPNHIVNVIFELYPDLFKITGYVPLKDVCDFVVMTFIGLKDEIKEKRDGKIL